MTKKLQAVRAASEIGRKSTASCGYLSELLLDLRCHLNREYLHLQVKCKEQLSNKDLRSLCRYSWVKYIHSGNCRHMLLRRQSFRCKKNGTRIAVSIDLLRVHEWNEGRSNCYSMADKMHIVGLVAVESQNTKQKYLHWQTGPKDVPQLMWIPVRISIAGVSLEINVRAWSWRRSRLGTIEWWWNDW